MTWLVLRCKLAPFDPKSIALPTEATHSAICFVKSAIFRGVRNQAETAYKIHNKGPRVQVIIA